MIPTFVITLREGVEASLIVGIIAAFLVKEGRKDALRQMWIGVGIAIVLCTAVGVGLDILNEDLPQKQQEGLETIVGLVAVATISYMIIWMTRHSRAIKGELEGEVASALAGGSAMALVGMAFLAVLREGFETSVFLLAAFQNSTNTTAAGSGAVLGLIGAVAIGLGLYRGGVRINLSKFFKITGLILVFVAAGLLATAAHTAHEAGWINSFQSEAVSLRWLVHPGTVDRIAAHRDAGPAPGPDPGRGVRLPGLRRPDGALRPLAAHAVAKLAAAAPSAASARPRPRPSGMSLTRRRLLASAGIGAAGVGLGAGGYLIGHDAAEADAAESTGAVPFYGEHQAGIATPSRTVSTSPPSTSRPKAKHELRELMEEWTRAAVEMTAGKMIGNSAGNHDQLAPPEDTGEAVGLPASNLTGHHRLRPRASSTAPASASPAGARRR